MAAVYGLPGNFANCNYFQIIITYNKKIKSRKQNFRFYHVVQDPRVLDTMLPYLTAQYGNPHSRTHAYGWESETAMEKARKVLINLSN